ncbi:MAG: hypothetical protein ABJC62_11385 [Frankiaceae bacterium]
MSDARNDNSNESSADPRAGAPGAANAPGGGGSDAGTDRAHPGPPPAASNQPKAEDFQPAQDASGEPGTIGSADPQGPSGGVASAPQPAGGSDDDRVERTGGFAAFAAPKGALADDDSAGASRTAPGSPPASISWVPTPGDSAGVNVPSGLSAAGTSEDSDQVSGIRATSIAPPGKPDGEVDTSR